LPSTNCQSGSDTQKDMMRKSIAIIALVTGLTLGPVAALAKDAPFNIDEVEFIDVGIKDLQVQIVWQLVEQGFYEFEISRTLLGRVRIVAISKDFWREIVFNSYNGELLRDYFEPLSDGGSVSIRIPKLFSAKDDDGDKDRSGSNSGSGSSNSGSSDDYEPDDEDEPDEEDDDDEEDD
jgi:hypothetical protein